MGIIPLFAFMDEIIYQFLFSISAFMRNLYMGKKWFDLICYCKKNKYKSINYSCENDFSDLQTPVSLAFLNWDFIETLSQATGYKNISVTIDARGKKYILPLLDENQWDCIPSLLACR